MNALLYGIFTWGLAHFLQLPCSRSSRLQLVTVAKLQVTVAECKSQIFIGKS